MHYLDIFWSAYLPCTILLQSHVSSHYTYPHTTDVHPSNLFWGCLLQGLLLLDSSDAAEPFMALFLLATQNNSWSSQLYSSNWVVLYSNILPVNYFEAGRSNSLSFWVHAYVEVG